MFKKLLGRQVLNNNKRQPSEAEENVDIEREYNYHLNQKKDKIPPFILHPDYGSSE